MEHVETSSITILMGRESLRSVRGEKHIFKMLKDSSPQGVNAECGVNRAAGAGGQIGHFSLDFAAVSYTHLRAHET